MCQLRKNIWFSRFAVTLVFCGTQFTNHVALGAEPAPDPNQEAVTLVERMLQVNRPWLLPSPIQGTYSELEKQGGVGDGELTGPFALERKVTVPVTYMQQVARVGSILWTPLHNMIRGVVPYSVQMIGKTNWSNVNVVAIDVAFEYPMRCAIGFGREHTNSAYCDYRNQNARILIEPTNAIPIYIDTSIPAGPTTGLGIEATWRFDTNFFAVHGGSAPQALEWNDSKYMRERQEFQVHDQEWIFRHGSVWGGPKWELAWTVELIDVTLVDISRMTIQKSGDNITLSWPTYGRGGVVLESARGVEGSWSTLLSQETSDITDVSVTLPVNQGVQFYRLRR